jgi:hypothetical protein
MIFSLCYYCVLTEFVQKMPVRVCFSSYKRICFGRKFAVQTVTNLNISLYVIQAIVSLYFCYLEQFHREAVGCVGDFSANRGVWVVSSCDAQCAEYEAQCYCKKRAEELL